jgi:uncharacterized membrane protein
MDNNVEQGKQIATISYLTILGTIIAIFMNNDSKNTFAAFHIRQALGISTLWFALGYFIGYFDSWFVSSAFYLFIFILWVYGFVGVINGEQKILPIVGEFFQKLFKSI